MKTLAVAILTGLGLPVLALLIMFLIARAPDDYQGRVLVIVDDSLSDTESFTLLAQAQLRPLRVIGQVNGWIAEADQAGGVGRLNTAAPVHLVLRDIGMGRALAGCLSLASGPARPSNLQR